MARTYFYDVAIDIGAGGAAIPLEDIEVTVTLRDGSSTQIYTAATGGGAMGNPFLTGATGDISFWADGGAYKIHIEDTEPSPRISPRDIYWDSVPHEDFIHAVEPGTLVAMAVRFPTSDNWLLCDGRAVSRTAYPRLWDAVRRDASGTLSSSSPYGNGNGTTTFNLPEMRSRVPLGADLLANLHVASGSPGDRGGGEMFHTGSGTPNLALPYFQIVNWFIATGGY